MLEKMMSKLMEEEHKRIEREEISRELYLVEKERKLADEAIKLAMKKKRTARQQLEEMVRLGLHGEILFFFSLHVILLYNTRKKCNIVYEDC